MSNLKGAIMKRFFRSSENVSDENKERKDKGKSVHGFAVFAVAKVKTTWQARTFQRNTAVETDKNGDIQEKKKLGSRSMSLSSLGKKSTHSADLKVVQETCAEDVKSSSLTDKEIKNESDNDNKTEKSEKMALSCDSEKVYPSQRRNVVMGVRAAKQQYSKQKTLTTSDSDSDKENNILTANNYATADSEPLSASAIFNSPLSKCIAAFAFLDDEEGSLNGGKVITRYYPSRPPVATPRKHRQGDVSKSENPVPKPRTLPPFYWRPKTHDKHKHVLI